MSLYKTISRYYDELFPLKKARLDFITSFFNGDGLSVMDIGCAAGASALALAKAGHRVIGIDLNRDMVESAREKAQKSGLSSKAVFFVKNMTGVGSSFPPSSFDAALCFGNTLVHLENPAKMEAFFSGVLKTLKDDGVFIVQIVNYDRILTEGVTELPLLESKACTFRREYTFDPTVHRICFNAYLTVKETGAVRESMESLYPLTSLELRTALENAGFSGIRFFGNENKDPYNRHSPALIALAQK
jgi:SAM-dependent methyltransferase